MIGEWSRDMTMSGGGEQANQASGPANGPSVSNRPAAVAGGGLMGPPGRHAADASRTVSGTPPAYQAPNPPYPSSSAIAIAQASGSDDSDESSDSPSTSSSPDEHAGNLSGKLDHVEVGRNFLRKLDLPENTPENSGNSPLMIAAWLGRSEDVGELLASCAPVNLVNPRSGDTALILATVNRQTAIVQQLLNVQDIDRDTANHHGDTALMLAASNNSPDIVECLLNADADVNLVNRKGDYSALSLAAKYGWSDIVRELMKVPGIEINWADAHGDTPLMHACAGGHAETVRALLDADADVTPVDHLGYDAFNLAVHARSAAVAELFIARRREPLDFRVSYASDDPFDITVADLFARSDPIEFRPCRGEPLKFFISLNKAVSASVSIPALTKWLCDNGILLAVARQLAVLLAPAQAWALKTGASGSKGSAPQRLIYCISAFQRLSAGDGMERVHAICRQAGISKDAITELGTIACSQLTELARLAGAAAAQLGGNLLEKMLDYCLAETSPLYEVRSSELQRCLVQAGFIAPLAEIIVSGWQKVLANLRDDSTPIPANLSPVRAIEHVHKLLTGSAQVELAGMLKKGLSQRARLQSLGSLLKPDQEEVIHMLFQIQCDWIKQFCEQALAVDHE